MNRITKTLYLPTGMILISIVAFLDMIALSSYNDDYEYAAIAFFAWLIFGISGSVILYVRIIVGLCEKSIEHLQ